MSNLTIYALMVRIYHMCTTLFYLGSQHATASKFFFGQTMYLSFQICDASIEHSF